VTITPKQFRSFARKYLNFCDEFEEKVVKKLAETGNVLDCAEFFTKFVSNFSGEGEREKAYTFIFMKALSIAGALEVNTMTFEGKSSLKKKSVGKN